MLRAAATGKVGDQLCREVHRVQVPINPLFGVDAKTAGPAAFVADHTGADLRKADLNSSILELVVERLHMPAVMGTELTGVGRRQCFCPGNRRQKNHRFKDQMPWKSPKCPKIRR